MGVFCCLVPAPPCHSLLKPAAGAGFAKCLCKILSPKGLGVEILKTQHLARSALGLPTATPVPIMPHFKI